VTETISEVAKLPKEAIWVVFEDVAADYRDPEPLRGLEVHNHFQLGRLLQRDPRAFHA
jgi:hypothetical protein